MKPVDLSGAVFHMDVTLLALKRFREERAIATEFFTQHDPQIVFEIRIKSVGGKRITARDARIARHALKASGPARKRAR